MKDNKDDKLDNRVREIEFRGKAVTPRLLKLSEREWHYGSLVSKYDVDAGLYCQYHILEKSEYTRSCDWDSDLVNVDFYEVDENTLGQFTGLCDKDGKKIYEGDIVSVYSDCDGYYVEERNLRGVVVFDDECFFDYEVSFNHIRNCCLEYLANHRDNIEVIGNIYDNPELLGGSDEECDN